MKNWKIKDSVEVKNVRDDSLSPIILSLLFQRGIDTKEKIDNFLFPNYERDVLDPFLFSQMEQAVKRIGQARDKNEKVAIFGDYDADGVTSTAILKETMDKLGIVSITYIPDKKIDGYGMNLTAIEEFKKSNVKLIITVDCGITNVEEIEKASQYGMDTIITDHHNIPSETPVAIAIINHKLENSGYPSNALAGVGVAFKLVQALYQRFLTDQMDQVKWLLDLVAIGTVADCVPLIGENRALVKYGLVVLSKTRRTGLREIFSVARLKIDEDNFPDSHNISFQIAPRINAAGRVDHANTAYNLIMENNPVKARVLALELESNNQQRQKITEEVVKEIKSLAEEKFKDKKFIFAIEEHFPVGVVGLVAGKIADAFNKPTGVLRRGGKTSEGSFRSIPQLSIIKAIDECKDLLIKFGGHDQAAGLKIDNKNIDKFYDKLNSVIERELVGKDLSPQIEIDKEINAEDIDFSLVESLDKLNPFGEGNKKPVFLARNLIVDEINVVGKNAKHLKIFLRFQGNSPKIFEAIGFNMVSGNGHIQKGDMIDAVFNLEKDEWNGSKKIQLKLIDLKKSV